MSVELLARQDEGEDLRMDSNLIANLGSTVFEKLAIEADRAMDSPEGTDKITIVNSVTRLGDGQTVPDER